MKYKIKLLIMLLSINMFTPIVSMKRDREEVKEESHKKIKLEEEQPDQENLSFLEQLPVEVIIKILTTRMEDIIKNSNVLQWVDQVYRFIREISLINNNFRNIINYIINFN